MSEYTSFYSLAQSFYSQRDEFGGSGLEVSIGIKAKTKKIRVFATENNMRNLSEFLKNAKTKRIRKTYTNTYYLVNQFITFWGSPQRRLSLGSVQV